MAGPDGPDGDIPPRLLELLIGWGDTGVRWDDALPLFLPETDAGELAELTAWAKGPGQEHIPGTLAFRMRSLKPHMVSNGLPAAFGLPALSIGSTIDGWSARDATRRLARIEELQRSAFAPLAGLLAAGTLHARVASWRDGPSGPVRPQLWRLRPEVKYGLLESIGDILLSWVWLTLPPEEPAEAAPKQAKRRPGAEKGWHPANQDDKRRPYIERAMKLVEAGEAPSFTDAILKIVGDPTGRGRSNVARAYLTQVAKEYPAWWESHAKDVGGRAAARITTDRRRQRRRNGTD